LANIANAAKQKAQQATPFEAGSDEFRIAQVIADQNVPVSQWRLLWSGLAKNAADKPRMLSTVLSLKPDYEWNQNEFDFAAGKSEANVMGRTTPRAIGGQASLTHAKAMAQQSPDVQAAKVEAQARGQSAKTLNNQLQAAQRAVSTFKDALNKYGQFENIPQFLYRDLASDYAKILMATGQIAEGSVDKVMQASLAGDIVKAYNYATGDTKTTAPQKVLQLMYNRISGLQTDIEKQLSNQVSGGNMPISSDASTAPENPLSPTPAKPKGIKAPLVPETRVVNGVSYTKGKDGLWHKQK
jgi:hypothetical protein